MLTFMLILFGGAAICFLGMPLLVALYALLYWLNEPTKKEVK